MDWDAEQGARQLTTAWGSKGIKTGHPMHEHEDKAALYALHADPSALPGLALASRERYARFLAEAHGAMADMFARVKVG